MQCVEEDNFQSEELKEISGQLANEKELASHAIKRLSSYIGGLDQRFSLAGIIFNLFYLRDTRHAILLERWIQTYSDKLRHPRFSVGYFGGRVPGTNKELPLRSGYKRRGAILLLSTKRRNSPEYECLFLNEQDGNLV